MDNDKMVTLKVWEKTRRLLRLIAAHTGQTILETVHRMAQNEWSKVQDGKTDTPDTGQVRNG